MNRAFAASAKAILALALFAMVASSLGTTAEAANGPPPMTVPGHFNVSQGGAFTYAIPITASPGTVGMSPTLSLDYSSQNGDGITGLGWSVDGLSTITRCARTVAQDAVHGGVNYDANDRFCLDGQRLILVSGTYGADGSVYRTEIDHFSKIVAHGTAGTGPAWLEVHTPSGLDLQYGDTTDSRILAVGTSTARAWALNKVTNPKGDYYTVSYTNDTTNGQFYPASVNYTGNAGAGLSTYNSVQFSYTTRPDIVPTYQAGSLIQTTVLLTDIKTYAGSSLVLDYKLTYTLATSAATHDELNEVQICNPSGTCLAPTTFGWQGSRANPSVTTAANSTAHGQTLYFGDFNADGLTDFALNPGATCPTTNAIYLGSTSGSYAISSYTTTYHWFETSPTPPTPITNTYSGFANLSGCWLVGGVAVGDIVGNGFTDLVINEPYYRYVGGAWRTVQTSEILLNNLSGALNQANANDSIPYWPYIFSPPAFPSDFNGDGRADGYVSASGTLTPYFSNGDGTFSAGSGYSLPSTAATIETGDFDGDGCTDIVAEAGLPSPTNKIEYFCQPAVASYSFTAFPTGQHVIGDFNGDGKSDFLVLTSSGATLYLSTGTGLGTGIVIPSSSSWLNYGIAVGDWNGDGKDDIALISTTSGTPHIILLSTGTGFTQIATPANSNTGVLATVVADWNNDGAKDIWIQGSSADSQLLFSYTPELMTSVSNGIGATTSVTYDRLNHGTIYTKGSGATYPTEDLDGPIYAVSTLTQSNGIGGTEAWTYAYAGMKKDQSGRGNLGFSQIKVTDSQTGIVTTSNFQTAFPETGLVSSQTVVSGTTTLRSVSNTYTATNEGTGSPGAAYYFVSLQQSVVSGADLDGSTLPTTTTTFTYDGYGNPLTQSATVSDGSSSTVTNTYNNDTTNWFIGQLLTSKTENVVGSSDLTRQSSYSWDPTYNLLTSQIVEPEASSDPSLKLETDYGYDALGNRTSATAKGCVWVSSLSCSTTTGTATRATTAVFDATTLHGQFTTKLTNALSQYGTWAYAATNNIAFGVPSGQTDVNSLTTSGSYDTFGRTTLVTRPDGNKIAFAYAYCTTTSCPVLPVGQTLAQVPINAQFYVLTTPENSSGTQNGPIHVTYYDSLMRVLATDGEGFDASGTGCTLTAPCWIRTATQYDAYGRVSQTSRPYFVPSGTAKWTVYTYDILNRVTKATFPDTSTTQYGFHGLTTTVTNSKSQVTTTVKNAQGLNASVEDANSKITSYLYDAFGDLTKVTDPSSNVITNTYDIRGRKKTSSDPDMGSWSYVYDGFGELYGQTDAKSQVTTLTYDALGRPLTRTEPSLTSTWVYDTASGKGVGQIASATTGSNYTRTYAYDTLARPSTVTLTVDGTAHPYGLGYDTNGRLQSVAYPSGFTASYSYTTLGYSYQVSDASLGTVFWTAKTSDAELHLLTQTAGNSVTTTQSFDPNTGLPLSIAAGTSNTVANQTYTYDTLGNLTSRTWLNNAGASVKEDACYDNLNRLTSTLITTGTACTGTGAAVFAYDQLGNISSKSGIGTYGYGAGAAGPHAVTSITGTYLGLTNPVLTYDANGNMTCVSTASGCTGTVARSVTYTSFNMAASITEGSSSETFTYDTEHARVKMVATGTNAGTTTYLNDPTSDSMEEEFVSGSGTTFRDYIIANGQMVALRSVGAGAPPVWGASTWGSFNWTASGTPTVLYFTPDQLGSISVITNSSGTVMERDSYDAWGARRNADGSAASCGAITSATTRGFTSQEMLDAVCAINFNARIYDPALGRFMGADSIVSDPMDGQSFNRYSYVNNGPLSATDPSGYYGDSEVQPHPIPYDCDTSTFCAGSRLPGGDPSADTNLAALLSTGSGGGALADLALAPLVPGLFGLTCSGGETGCWTPTSGSSYEIPGSDPETIVVQSTHTYWVPGITSLGQPGNDTNGAGSGSFYTGLGTAFDVTGKMLDAQNALTGILLGTFGKGTNAAEAISGVDKTLGVIGGVLVIGQQSAVAASEISKGVPADIAINGAALHAGTTIGSGILAGAATGALAGTFFGPPGEAIGGVAGGIAGSYGVELVLPSNDALGQWARQTGVLEEQSQLYGGP